jgi:hypothetical protein
VHAATGRDHANPRRCLQAGGVAAAETAPTARSTERGRRRRPASDCDERGFLRGVWARGRLNACVAEQRSLGVRADAYDWYVTFVLDLTTRQQTVRLRVPEHESCIVKAPDWLEERRLWHFYRRPSRARASVFVDEVLALCTDPHLERAEIAAMSAPERVRMRYAVASVCGMNREWRAMHGSHLTPDERLFAVMFWRWRKQQDLHARLRRRRLELEQERRLGIDTTALQMPADAALARVSPAVNFSKFYAAPLADAVSSVQRWVSGPLSISNQLELVSSTAQLGKNLAAIKATADARVSAVPSVELGLRPFALDFALPRYSGLIVTRDLLRENVTRRPPARWWRSQSPRWRPSKPRGGGSGCSRLSPASVSMFATPC